MATHQSFGGVGELRRVRGFLRRFASFLRPYGGFLRRSSGFLRHCCSFLRLDALQAVDSKNEFTP